MAGSVVSDALPARVGFSKEQREEMADAPSLLTRIVLRAQREAIEHEGDQQWPWRKALFLMLMQVATKGLPLRTIQEFGWFAPEAKLTPEGHVLTLYRPPGPLGEKPVMIGDIGELYAVDLGHYHEIAGRLCDIVERENGSQDEAQWVLNLVFQGWVKSDERPGHQRGATDDLRKWAQQFALKPGEAEKTEEARDKDGY